MQEIKKNLPKAIKDVDYDKLVDDFLKLKCDPGNDEMENWPFVVMSLNNSEGIARLGIALDTADPDRKHSIIEAFAMMLGDNIYDFQNSKLGNDEIEYIKKSTSKYLSSDQDEAIESAARRVLIRVRDFQNFRAEVEQLKRL